MANIHRPPLPLSSVSPSQQQDIPSPAHSRSHIPPPLPVPAELPPHSWNDQPPTQAGNPRARVFVACQACRTRKIKCDGVKPVCTNCHKKEFAPGADYQHLLPDNEKYKIANGICLYDQIPKRRGPDRTPGARVRKKYRQDESGHERSARRRATIDSFGNYNEDTSIYPRQSHEPPTNGHSRDHDSSHQFEGARPLVQPNRLPEDRESIYLHESRSSGSILTSIDASSAQPPLTSEPYTLQHPSVSRTEGSRTLSPPTSTTSSGSPNSIHQSAYARRSSSLLNSPADANGSIAHGPFYPPSQSFVSRDAQSRSQLQSPLDASGTLERQASLNFPTESPIARTTRERHGSWGHSRASFSLPYPHSSYPANNLSYEYVPSAGAYVQSVEESDPEERYRKSPDEVALTLPAVPGAGFVQKTWYDSLLDTYASFEAPSEFRGYYSSGSLILTSEVRRKAQASIVTDLRTFFARSSWWFSFIHVGTFWAKLNDPESRTSSALQPGIVLAALALASFNKSSEIEGGVWGRERAARLRADAEAAVDNSLAVGWVDIGLAQAAWLLAMYEICPHPYHTLQKARSAMTRLDNIIRLLKCSTVDANNPAVTHFDRTATPIVLHRQRPISSSRYPVAEYAYSGDYVSYENSSSPTVYQPTLNYRDTMPSQNGYKSVASLQYDHAHILPLNSELPPSKVKGCCCGDLSFGKNSFTPLWEFSPRWLQGYSPAEIQREEARRIVWSYVTLASALGGHTAGLGQDKELDTYWSASAENFSLLFPGEAAFYENPVSHQVSDVKNSVWSLYCRAELLWLACLRMRHSVMRADGLSGGHTNELGLYSIAAPSETLGNASSESDMASFVMRTWLQTKEIEDALDAHTCNIERAFLFHGREHLSSIRMLITQDFSRYVPFPNSEMSLFNRHQANDWLKHQSAMCRRMMAGLQHVTGLRLNILAHRPFFVWWFMIQLLRLLNLWARDQSMTEALELSFSFLPPIDYLTAIWPSENQKNKYFVLRQRLDEACRISGLPLPPPPNLNVESYREPI